jgi:acetyl esterase/lipase
MQARNLNQILLFVLMVFLLLNPALAESVVSRDIDYISETDYADGKDFLDIHMPENANGVPVIVYFHGGRLMANSKERGDEVGTRLAAMGIGLVSANYRLSPAVVHPAHVQDAAAAMAWVVENIAKYGGDPDNLYLSGHSSGAYLAVLLALDASHLAVQSLKPDMIRGVIPISPFLYVEETAAVRPKVVWGDDPAGWLEASVTPHIKAGKAPMLLIYADGDEDWRKLQNERFGEAMRAVGNEDTDVIEIPNRNHGSLINAINMDDDRIGDLILKFIQEH